MEENNINVTLIETRCNSTFDHFPSMIISSKTFSKTCKDLIDHEFFEELGVMVDGICDNFIIPFHTFQFYFLMDQIHGKNRFDDLNFLFAGVCTGNAVEPSVIKTHLLVSGVERKCRLPLVVCVELDIHQNIIQTHSPMVSDAVYMGFYEFPKDDVLEFVINGNKKMLPVKKNYKIPMIYACRVKHSGFQIGYLHGVPSHGGSSVLILNEEFVPSVPFFLFRRATKIGKPATLRLRTDRKDVLNVTPFAKVVDDDSLASMKGIVEDITSLRSKKFKDGTVIEETEIAKLYEFYAEDYSSYPVGTKRPREDMEQETIAGMVKRFYQTTNFCLQSSNVRVRSYLALLFLHFHLNTSDVAFYQNRLDRKYDEIVGKVDQLASSNGNDVLELVIGLVEKFQSTSFYFYKLLGEDNVSMDEFKKWF